MSADALEKLRKKDAERKRNGRYLSFFTITINLGLLRKVTFHRLNEDPDKRRNRLDLMNDYNILKRSQENDDEKKKRQTADNDSHRKAYHLKKTQNFNNSLKSKPNEKPGPSLKITPRKRVQKKVTMEDLENDSGSDEEFVSNVRPSTTKRSSIPKRGCTSSTNEMPSLAQDKTSNVDPMTEFKNNHPRMSSVIVELVQRVHDKFPAKSPEKIFKVVNHVRCKEDPTLGMNAMVEKSIQLLELFETL